MDKMEKARENIRDLKEEAANESLDRDFDPKRAHYKLEDYAEHKRTLRGMGEPLDRILT